MGPFWTNLGHLSGPLCPAVSPGVTPTPPPLPIAPCAREPVLLHEQPWAQDHQLLWCQPLARFGEMHFKHPMPLNHTATAGKNRPRATFLTTSPRIQCPLSLCRLCQVGQRHHKASSQPIFLKLSSILKNTAGLLPEWHEGNYRKDFRLLLNHIGLPDPETGQSGTQFRNLSTKLTWPHLSLSVILSPYMARAFW